MSLLLRHKLEEGCKTSLFLHPFLFFPTKVRIVKSPRLKALLKVNFLRVVFEVVSAIVDPSFRGRYMRYGVSLSRSNNSGVDNLGSKQKGCKL